MKRVINFMGVRHVAFALTVLLTVASLGSLVVKGLNFGLDFTGGTLIELGYERPVELEQVRGQLVQAGFTDAVVQSFGATTDVLVRMPGDDPQLGERIASALRNADGGNAVSVKRVEFVGPAVGEELRDQGGLGMLLALGGMYELLIPFLILLGSIIPPIGGVIMADYFYRHRGQYPKLAEAHLPRYNSLGLAAYVLGAACAYFSPWVAPIVGILVAAAAYIVLYEGQRLALSRTVLTQTDAR